MIRKIVEKIAVAAYKKEETFEISTQSGRAPFFLIFDKSGDLIVTLGRRQLTLVHRRSDTELLARVEEVQHAKGVATNRLGAELRQVWSS